MSNSEIRQKARRLHITHFIWSLVLGLCYSKFSIFNAQIQQNINGWIVLVIGFILLTPLSMGAVWSVMHLWETEQEQKQIFQFYRLDLWGASLLLSVLSQLAMLIPSLIAGGLIVISAGVFAVAGAMIALVGSIWIGLRLYMAMVLFITYRTTSDTNYTAMQALKDSFMRMRGQMGDLFWMQICVYWPCWLILNLQRMQSPMELQWMLTGFLALYLPYPTLACIGWVVERNRGENCPQEVETHPVLHQKKMYKDFGKSNDL